MAQPGTDLGHEVLDDIRFQIQANSLEHWVFDNNAAGWMHPIHVHMEEFQILSRNGLSPSGVDRSRKDVVGLQHNETIKVFFRFRDWLGRYPMHCHNVVHEDHAMMLRWVQALLGARMGKDIFFCSFTLKPELDSPRVLGEYSRRFGAGPGWQFLTGSPRELERCRQRLGFTDPDPARDTNKLNHTGMVRFGNEPLMLWSACPGLSAPESLAHSILSVDWHGRHAGSPMSGPGAARATLTSR